MLLELSVKIQEALFTISDIRKLFMGEDPDSLSEEEVPKETLIHKRPARTTPNHSPLPTKKDVSFDRKKYFLGLLARIQGNFCYFFIKLPLLLPLCSSNIVKLIHRLTRQACSISSS